MEWMTSIWVFVVVLLACGAVIGFCSESDEVENGHFWGAGIAMCVALFVGSIHFGGPMFCWDFIRHNLLLVAGGVALQEAGLPLRQDVFGHIPGAGDVKTGIEPLFAWIRVSIPNSDPKPGAPDSYTLSYKLYSPAIGRNMVAQKNLRWGVPAKDLNGETANSWEYCRQWIDRVEPFFVCILGQRYGWCPLPPQIAVPIVTT